MTQRIVELVFRHKFLLAVPIILGLIGGLMALSLADSPYYISWAGIWVERPTDLTGGDYTEFDAYATPAQNQSGAMRELLGVNAFASEILEHANEGAVTPLSLGDLRRNTLIYPGGDHLLYVEHHASNPEQAMQTVNAIVSEYASLYTAQIKDKASRAKMFYEDQLNASRTILEQANSELKAYVARNPQFLTVNLDNPPSSSLRDLEFAGLVAAEQTARESYDQLLAKFADSQISANFVEGAIPNFLVLDEPVLPTTPVRPGKRALLMPPIMGLAGGVLLSSLGFFVYWRLDRRIHLPDDLSFLGPGIPVMTLPAATAKRRNWPLSFVRVATAIQNGLKPSGQAAVGQ
jgi:uncharacterized protein involved in exopolysaccharide biosynthesis